MTGRIKLLRTENNRKRLRNFSFKTEGAAVDNCRCKGREAPCTSVQIRFGPLTEEL